MSQLFLPDFCLLHGSPMLEASPLKICNFWRPPICQVLTVVRFLIKHGGFTGHDNESYSCCSQRFHFSSPSFLSSAIFTSYLDMTSSNIWLSILPKSYLCALPETLFVVADFPLYALYIDGHCQCNLLRLSSTQFVMPVSCRPGRCLVWSPCIQGAGTLFSSCLTTQGQSFPSCTCPEILDGVYPTLQTLH